MPKSKYPTRIVALSNSDFEVTISVSGSLTEYLGVEGYIGVQQRGMDVVEALYANSQMMKSDEQPEKSEAAPEKISTEAEQKENIISEEAEPKSANQSKTGRSKS